MSQLHTIYTAGYSGHSPTQLRDAAEKLKATVVDIRLKPKSRNAGWSRDELQRSIPGYFHYEPLGNPGRFDGGGMRLQDEQLGIRSILRWAENSSIILLCQCVDSSKCHRSHISKLLGERGVQTMELKWPLAEQIPALSLWQPYASLVGLREKRNETRSWQTSYRGPIAIHAAKRWTGEETYICHTKHFREALIKAKLMKPHEPGNIVKSNCQLPLGVIVAVGYLIEILPVEEVTNLSPQERAFGNYGPNRFAWIFKNMRALKTPVPLAGSQNIFKVDTALFKEQLDL